MGEIDLDAARQARLEQSGGRSFTFRGERFELPPELPYAVLEPLTRLGRNERDLGALRDTMAALLGQESHARFESLDPSLADLNELVGFLFVEYGLGGESSSNGAGAGEVAGAPGPKSPPSSPPSSSGSPS